MLFSRTLSLRAAGGAAGRAAARMTCCLAVAAVLQVGTAGIDPNAAAQAQTVMASSDFENGHDGWSAAGDPRCVIPEWWSAGGAPGGRIRIIDAQEGVGLWFMAPPKFLGSQSTAYGGTLSYDVRVETESTPDGRFEITFIGDGAELVIDAGENPPRNVWHSYTVDLHEAAGWWLWECAGERRPATRDEFLSALSNLSAIRIFADYHNGPDYVSLDNVVLTAGPCDLPDGRLSASCKDGRGLVTAKLSRGLPDISYEFCLDGGDCIARVANSRGKAKAKFKNVAPGAHEVTIPDCDLAAPVECR